MNKGLFVFGTGLVLTLGGVGGIEQSISDAELYTAVIISAVGLMIMYAGSKIVKRSAA